MLPEITDHADWKLNALPSLPLSLSAGFVWSVSLFVNFNLEPSIPLYDKVEQKPAGTKIDVYLPAFFSSFFPVTVITTITSSLLGMSLILSFPGSDKPIR